MSIDGINPQELPFVCERHAASHKSDGFVMNDKFYKGVDDLLHKEAGWAGKYEYFKDIYRRKIVNLRRRVPTFDHYDAKYDRRHWNWFYYVKSFRTLEVVSLAAYFGEDADDWDWLVYENIKDLGGGKLNKPRGYPDVFPYSGCLFYDPDF